MDGDCLGSVSSGPMPRPVTSLKVGRWFGEGLRQWRRPSRASSATSRTRVTGGTAYGGGAPPPPPSRSPNVPGFVWWGRWCRLATALEYAVGYFDLAVVGALELPWSIGIRAANGGLVALLADLWGNAMYAKTEGSTTSAASAVLAPVRAVRGLLYLLLIWMWRRLKRRWTTMGLMVTLRPFRPLREDPGSPRPLPRVQQLACRNHCIRVRLRKVHTRIPTSDRGWRKTDEACHDICPGPGSWYAGWS